MADQMKIMVEDNKPVTPKTTEKSIVVEMLNLKKSFGEKKGFG